MELLDLVLKYALVPFGTLAWWLFKKQDLRIDSLERKTSEMEKALIEIRTEFKFISRDIKEIKDMLLKLQEHK